MSEMYSNQSCVASTSTLPPSYEPSGASPPYASEPTELEQRLDYVARVLPNRVPRGIFTKATRRVVVVLMNQEDGIDAPVYARHGAVSGEVILQETNVTSVSVKVSRARLYPLYSGLM